MTLWQYHQRVLHTSAIAAPCATRQPWAMRSRRYSVLIALHIFACGSSDNGTNKSDAAATPAAKSDAGPGSKPVSGTKRDSGVSTAKSDAAVSGAKKDAGATTANPE